MLWQRGPQATGEIVWSEWHRSWSHKGQGQFLPTFEVKAGKRSLKKIATLQCHTVQLTAGPCQCANLLQSMLGNSLNWIKVLLVGPVCTESECLVLLQLMEMSCFGALLFRDTHLWLKKKKTTLKNFEWDFQLAALIDFFLEIWKCTLFFVVVKLYSFYFTLSIRSVDLATLGAVLEEFLQKVDLLPHTHTHNIPV